MKMKNALIASLIIILSFTTSIAQKKDFTNDDIWHSSKFNSKSVSGVRSMNDGEHFTTLDREDGAVLITKYSYKDYRKVEVIADSRNLLPPEESEAIQFSGYEFSQDESKLLLSTEVERVYRRSSKAHYYVYDLQSKNLKPLTRFELGKQRLAEFSPNGMKVAFVRDNDLFITDLISGAETRVTQDGEYNQIINGYTDWVYEEEFGFDKGFYWSPEGSKIAFYRFDEKHVKQFHMPMYGDLYPSLYTFKYPKAGEENSHVTIHVYDLQTTSISQCNVGSETDQYIPRIKWMADNNSLCIYRLNRFQNQLELLRVNTVDMGPTLESTVFFTERSDTYIEESNYDNLIFLENNREFILTSDRDGFMHLYRFDLKGTVVNQITKGPWDVQNLVGFDTKNNLIYYTARENSPLQSHVYSIKLDGSDKKTLTSKKGMNRALFSNGMKYFINYHSDANSPVSVTLHTAKGKPIKVLEDNAELKGVLADYELSPKEFFKFATSDGTELNGWMIKPADFNPTIQYPVLLYVYGGPGSNTVIDSWGGSNYYWHQMLAQNGIIVASVDNRGTGYRGRDFKNVTYKQLGYYEIEDQIEAAKYLGSLDYIDANRIGIQGWSYGGYMSSLAITKGADLFSTAIAVAPVTSWRYYDTIYTERYMQTPQVNPSGYDDNSPINHVEKLRGSYLLVHGSADDNVHYQNTMEMINALVKANKQFDLFIYPDKNHGIFGGTTRLHLYDKMTSFLYDNLKTSKSINLLD